MTNECEVYFRLFGDDFDPIKITEILRIEPTSAKRKGSPLPKKAYWKLSTGKIEADFIDVYEMVSSLVDRLIPLTEEINRAQSKYHLEAVLQVVLWISTDETISTPAIGFDVKAINFLNSVGASIDIDTYKN